MNNDNRRVHHNLDNEAISGVSGSATDFLSKID